MSASGREGPFVAQILRVNHAGECGAIAIYTAQITISRLLHRDIVGTLQEMLAHEKEHYQRFDQLLKQRGLRSCHALPAWSMGGWLLGCFTALIGERAIWVCTAAIESTVNQHLEQQVPILRQQDFQVLAAVEAIQVDEKAHETLGRDRAGLQNAGARLLWRFISGCVHFAIWLSARL